MKRQKFAGVVVACLSLVAAVGAAELPQVVPDELFEHLGKRVLGTDGAMNSHRFVSDLVLALDVGSRSDIKGPVFDLPDERTVFGVLCDELDAALAKRKDSSASETVCRVARITQPGVQKVTRVEKARCALEGDLIVVSESYEWPEKHHKVPSVTFVPKTPAGAPAIIVGDGNRTGRRRAVEKALAEGRVVVVADLLGTGEIDGCRFEHDARPEKVKSVAVLLYTIFRAVVDLFQRDPNVKLSLAEGFALSLEFKMGGELLRTVIVREWKELLILGAVILLRAALTFLIHWEISIETKKELDSPADTEKTEKKA